MNDPLIGHDAEILAEVNNSIRADLDAGVPLEKITASLEQVGWTHQEADAIVSRAYAARLSNIADIQDHYAARYKKLDQKQRSGAWLRVAIGAFMLFGGLAVTIGSYAMARNNGGVYILTWGIMVVGAIRLLTGLSDLRGK